MSPSARTATQGRSPNGWFAFEKEGPYTGVQGGLDNFDLRQWEHERRAAGGFSDIQHFNLLTPPAGGAFFVRRGLSVENLFMPGGGGDAATGESAQMTGNSQVFYG